LLVPLKRSPQYRAIRSQVSDVSPSDAWQQDGLHFFTFTLGRVDGNSAPAAEPPVAVFAMRPDEQEPVSAVVVRTRPEGQEPEITPVAAAEVDSATPAS
jgi:hypothetical protein